MLIAFERTARLRNWTNSSHFPQTLTKIKNAFDRCIGARREDNLSPPAETDRLQEAPDDLRNLILRPEDLAYRPTVQVHLRTRYNFNGRGYSTEKTDLGNSLILFRPVGNLSAAVQAGRIQYIAYIGGRWILAIKRHLPPHDERLNEFLRFSNWFALTFSVQMGQLEVIETSWVYCHFGSFRYTDGEFIAVPLADVSRFRRADEVHQLKNYL